MVDEYRNLLRVHEGLLEERKEIEHEIAGMYRQDDRLKELIKKLKAERASQRSNAKG
jgi:hypothetical protein